MGQVHAGYLDEIDGGVIYCKILPGIEGSGENITTITGLLIKL